MLKFNQYMKYFTRVLLSQANFMDTKDGDQSKYAPNRDLAESSENNKWLGIDDGHSLQSTTRTSYIGHSKIILQPIAVKSESDSKEYATIVLPNGLTVLLISDVKNLIDTTAYEDDDPYISSDEDSDSSESEPTVEQTDDKNTSNHEKLAACSLTVSVGSFSDPEEVPGLAHLLEHMIFMGSKRYPEENEFDSFLSKRGGSNNAETSCESTTYYFECPEKHLKEALLRFGDCFIEPLLKKESISKEREAVESEFKINLTSDSCRTEQLLCSTAPLLNPAHKFMWGNLITLKENITLDEIEEKLHQFWTRHYSSNRMTIAIQGRLPLDILGSWAIESFRALPCNFQLPEKFVQIDPPFKAELFYRMCTVLPIQNTNKVQITWAFAPVIPLYRTKPLSYISFLIGHEGEGSLLQLLEEKLWALSITAGNSGDEIENNSIYSLFSIEIEITEQGLENIKDLLTIVFGYVKLIQNTGPVESTFDELKQVEEINFRFMQEIDPEDYVEELSRNMIIYPYEDFITGSRLFFEYSPESITNILKLMTPERANIMILSKLAAHKINLDRVEPWFNTRYSVSDVPENWMTAWKTCTPDPKLHLPKTNPFIASNFDILKLKDNSPELPQKIRDDEYVQVWYKQDTKFQLPHGCVKIYLISPIATATPQNAVMCELMTMIFKLINSKHSYPATMAGLFYKFRVKDNGFTLTFQGYNEKLQLLLTMILENLVRFGDNVTDDFFEVIKSQLKKKYRNLMIQPTALANELRLTILCDPFWSSYTKLEVLPEITRTQLKEFSKSVLESLYVRCLIQGNISKKQGLSMVDNIVETIKYKPILKDQCPKVKVRKISSGENILRVQSFNEQDTNCNVTNYYQCGINTIEESSKLEILMLIMHEPLFDQLRTKEQLAYDVDCQLRVTSNVLGLSLTVKSQAEKFKVDYVEYRMSSFLNKINRDIMLMDDETFEQIKESIIILKNQEDNDLREEVSRNWNEIVSDEFIFDRNSKEAALIKEHSKLDIYNYFCKILQDNDDSTQCLRKLSIQVDGEVDGETKHRTLISHDSPFDLPYEDVNVKAPIIKVDTDPSRKYISDIDGYKNSLLTYVS